MTDSTNVLFVTIGDGEELYEDGLEAIQQLSEGEPVDQPAMVTFADETQLGEVFNERTYTLLRVIREDEPSSIRETARLVGRDVKNVHEELTTLEALGVIRFDESGQAKEPVFPYDDLVISPFAHDSGDSAAAAP
jgi:predicted transcriptional regulator